MRAASRALDCFLRMSRDYFPLAADGRPRIMKAIAANVRRFLFSGTIAGAGSPT